MEFCNVAQIIIMYNHWFLYRMENELIDIKSRWESHISEISRSNVDRDVELETLRESVGQLNTELSQRKQDIDR